MVQFSCVFPPILLCVKSLHPGLAWKALGLDWISLRLAGKFRCMLTWRQNNKKLISKDHNFKHFPGENATSPSTGDQLW